MSATGTWSRVPCRLWLLVVAALAPGCGQEVAPAESFTVQVQRVRQGLADGLRAEAPLSAAEWESLRGLVGLRELVLHEGVADDSRADILASLADVERLVLRRSPLADGGFAALASCRALRDLNVPQATCTAAGIRSLAALPNLRSLRLGGPDLAGVEVALAVAALPRLESLHLIDVPIGDEGLGVLAELASLSTLYLDGADATAEAWQRYFEARPDVHVHVDQRHHDRDPRRHHDSSDTTHQREFRRHAHSP